MAEIRENVTIFVQSKKHKPHNLCTESFNLIWVDTNDIWDKGDLVGINILPKDLKIDKENEA